MSKLKEALAEQVQFNCDVSDVRYWGYFSICGLLLSLRTLYMLKHGLEPWDRVDQAAIQEWIANKEAQWEELEDADFKDLVIGDKSYDPFDVPSINIALQEEGLIYGAGYGLFKKPSFFLAKLFSTQEIDGYTVYHAEKEYARDLFWSPGMSQGKLIFLRLEPLKVLMWDKLLESGTKRDSDLEFAFMQYDLSAGQEAGAELKAKLEGVVRDYSDVVLYHELGEEAEDIPSWLEMLSEVDTKASEFFLRAVKDLLADTSEHGPIKRFVDRKDKGRISLCIALMDRYRLTQMYPELKEASNAFKHSGNWQLLEDARKSVYARAAGFRDELVESYALRKDKNDLLNKISELQAG